MGHVHLHTYVHTCFHAFAACFKPADEEPYAPNNPRGPELVADWGMVRSREEGSIYHVLQCAVQCV